MTDRDSDAIARIAAIAGLVGVAIVHALQLPDAFAAVDYLGVLFVALIVTCLGLAATMTRATDQTLWAAIGGLSALVLLGFVLSRTSGLPGFTGDIDEWTEPLGLVSLVLEGLLVFVSAAALGLPRTVTWPMPAQGGRA
jgi:hypothetical protein